jgi:hypothetical protein
MHKIVNGDLIVNCETLHLGPFSVLILNEGDGDYSYYLRHKNYCIMRYMFTIKENHTPDNEYLSDIALSNAPEYIPDFIRECFSE